ncbi:MAG: TlpA family protein disulfide reductase [Pyrinomonadaceae bacterium]
MVNSFLKSRIWAALVLAAWVSFGVTQAAVLNDAAASLSFKGVDGKTYDLSEMKGEVLVVSFGATWCKPCEWELAAWEDLKREFEGQPIRFLWVSIEGEDVPDQHLNDYAKKLKLTIPVLRDPAGVALARYNERARLPTVVFFDKEGVFAPPRHTGMSRDPEEYKKLMRSRLHALLGPAVSVPAIQTGESN